MKWYYILVVFDSCTIRPKRLHHSVISIYILCAMQEKFFSSSNNIILTEGFRNWETCLKRKLLFPLPPPSFLPYPTPPPSLTTSNRDFNKKFKFVGMNRPFLSSLTLFTFPSASCCILLLFLDGFPCHFYRLSPDYNNNACNIIFFQTKYFWCGMVCAVIIFVII